MLHKILPSITSPAASRVRWCGGDNAPSQTMRRINSVPKDRCQRRSKHFRLKKKRKMKKMKKVKNENENEKKKKVKMKIINNKSNNTKSNLSCNPS